MVEESGAVKRPPKLLVKTQGQKLDMSKLIQSEERVKPAVARPFRPSSESRLIRITNMTLNKYEQIMVRRQCSDEKVQKIREKYFERDALLRQHLV